MKHGLKYALGVATAALLALAASPAAADSVGPYYATPSWDQTLPASTRFIVLSNFNDQAVLDRETGLVWERTPSFPSATFVRSDAVLLCWNATTGGRKGWRLPRVEEFMSLADPSNSANSSLPPGNPFLNVFYETFFAPPSTMVPNALGLYWSTDLQPGAPGDGMEIQFVQLFGAGGQLSTASTRIAGLSDTEGVWCVRSGTGAPALQ